MMRRVKVVLAAVLAAVALLSIGTAPAAASVTFDVSFSSSVHTTPLDGRLLVIVSTTDDPEPRVQADYWAIPTFMASPPFWGMDVDAMQPDTPVTFADPDVYGFPYASLSELPAGEYYVQALLNVFTTFHRADGSVVKLHLPGGDGQNPFIAPGNLVSTPTKVTLGPDVDAAYELELDQELPPLNMVPPGGTLQQGNPPDTKHVKHVKIKSALLSKFWGQPMYIGATILLPEGYDDPANARVRYPVLWIQSHFQECDPPMFDESLADPISQWWVSKQAPRVITVHIRHENPFYDDSYGVNSANVGPYGDAIRYELMPKVESSFRIIRERWARTLVGGSTGGWEAAAQMVFHPRLYSGAWVLFPDPLTFHRMPLVDVYNDVNAYFVGDPSLGIARPIERDLSGALVGTMAQNGQYELALGGPLGRSGIGWYDCYQAVFGPQGANGYPAPIWDKLTGIIDPSVAGSWRRYDIDAYLQKHWARVGPLVSGRVFFFCGLADEYYYEVPLKLFEQDVAQLTDPKANFTFRWGPNGGHGWIPMTVPQLITDMARYMARQAPDGTDVSGWYRATASPSRYAAGHRMAVAIAR